MAEQNYWVVGFFLLLVFMIIWFLEAKIKPVVKKFFNMKEDYE